MRRVYLVVVALFLLAGSAAAQSRLGGVLLTITGGQAFGKSEATGENIDGPTLMGSFEQRTSSTPFSFYFSVGYSSLSSEESDQGERIQRDVSTWPFYFGTRYWMGRGRLQGYAGAAIGMYFSTLSTTTSGTEESYSSIASNGSGLGVPIGLSYAMSPQVNLVGGFALNWVWSNDFFENDLLYSVNLGFGFK